MQKYYSAIKKVFPESKSPHYSYVLLKNIFFLKNVYNLMKLKS